MTLLVVGLLIMLPFCAHPIIMSLEFWAEGGRVPYLGKYKITCEKPLKSPWNPP